MKTNPKTPKSQGFAIVVTLTLMMLLTVLAVGLLSLSSVSLRSASQGSALSLAQANARMALCLAIGELQKTTGPDRAITAPASIIDSKYPSGVTGVWTPWTAGSGGASRTKTDRNNNFRQWLVSSADGKTPDKPTAPPLTTFGSQDSITLLGDGSLGARDKGNNDDQRINVGTSRVVDGKSIGGFAWAVIDESTKARVDLYEKNPTGTGAAVLRAGAPPTDNVTALDGLDKLSPVENDARRMVSMATIGLLPGMDQKKLKMYAPDLTVDSASLLTDVVSGGLKKDLSIWFSKRLSSTEKTLKLYQDSKSVTTSYPSDPSLALLENFHQYYKNIDKKLGNVVPAAGGVVAKLPASYRPFRGTDNSYPAAPTEPLMVPTVLRVDLIFSLAARNAHGPHTPSLPNAGRPYMLHLLYLPVVTLHNPYNVPLSVDGMKITFQNVPIGFQFMLDGAPLSSQIVPLNQLFIDNQSNPSAIKAFGFTLGSSNTSGGATSFVMKPGQTKLFGTPSVAPTWTWQNDANQDGAGVGLFDWRNNQTSNFKMAPKLITTTARGGAGFDIDHINPGPLQTAAGRLAGNGGGILSMRGSERISVKYGPVAPLAGRGSFNVRVELMQSGAAREAGSFSLKYTDAARLKAIVEQGTSLRFPTPRSFPETFPGSGEKPIRVSDILVPANMPVRDYINPRPFVIFSVGSRTTKESFVPTRIMADGNPVMNVASIDLSANKDPVGAVPLEMVMMPIRGNTSAIEEDRDTEEGYAFGGNGRDNGSPRAAIYELPRGPLQSLAQFRHANLAGSGYMPLTTYTVGESRAHPQIGTDKINLPWTNGTMMLDHTWLSNESLWDRYFLSTIADQDSPQFASTKTYTEVMEDFFAMESRLPNQRFIPVNPGENAIPAALGGGLPPEEVIAGSLMLQGGFNVNSTSVNAWIAVLSGLRNADIETWAGMEEGEDKYSAFPRIRRPVGKNIDTQNINENVGRWEGYRSLSDSNIEALAKEITVEIRKRGPFLSLADFVNRGVGPDGDEINLKGAIQAAIDRVPAINQLSDIDGIELETTQLSAHGYQSVAAALGNTATNAPGSLTQGDILTSLGSRITVRADTFRIRAYGEARDVSGKKIIAKAWCEAVVQRMPEFVDSSDAPSVKQAALAPGTMGTANETFGRRYQVVSFRWLAPDEV